jgi:phenylalanyl-tRNA synthetase beta chain
LPRANTGLTQAAYTPFQKRDRLARRVLAMRGLQETVTYSFMPGKVAEQFFPADIQNLIRITNPISADLDVMRGSILPNLVQATARNAARGFHDCALFEVGPIYKNISQEGQSLVAAGLRHGMAVAKQWQNTKRNVDVFDVKADALALLEQLGVPTSNISISTDTPSYFHPGQSGVLRLGPHALAHFGVLHPALMTALDIPHACAGFEVFLAALPAMKEGSATKPLADMPDLQPVARDYAFIMGKDVPVDKLIKAIKGADKTLITQVQLFDVYEGKGVPDNHRSLAVAVTLQPREKSLTDADIESISAKLIADAQKATGAILRS